VQNVILVGTSLLFFRPYALSYWSKLRFSSSGLTPWVDLRFVSSGLTTCHPSRNLASSLQALHLVILVGSLLLLSGLKTCHPSRSFASSLQALRLTPFLFFRPHTLAGSSLLFFRPSLPTPNQDDNDFLSELQVCRTSS